MSRIIENTTPYRVNIWENYGKRRLYIDRYLNRLAHDLYIDLDTGDTYIKASKKRVNSSSFRVEQHDDQTIVTVMITSTLPSNEHIIIA